MRKYGSWSGNERGTPEDPAMCVASIYQAGRMIASQCARKRGHGPDGLYCKQHAKMVEEGRYVSVPGTEGRL